MDLLFQACRNLWFDQVAENVPIKDVLKLDNSDIFKAVNGQIFGEEELEWEKETTPTYVEEKN